MPLISSKLQQVRQRLTHYPQGSYIWVCVKTWDIQNWQFKRHNDDSPVDLEFFPKQIQERRPPKAGLAHVHAARDVRALLVDTLGH